MERIESLLSARAFLAPQIVGERIFFISNINGQMSLYAMNFGGSVPEPLLPPDTALQNPHLLTGFSFYVFPEIDQILVMIDSDGDEIYKPMLVPIDGGHPEPIFGNQLSDYRTHLLDCDPEKNIIYLAAESLSEPMNESFQGNLLTQKINSIARSQWGAYVAGASRDHQKIILIDAYTAGDHTGYLWKESEDELELIFGIPIEERQENQDIPINSITETYFTPGDGLLFTTSLFEDNYGLGYLHLSDPGSIMEIKINGCIHTGLGELEEIRPTNRKRYLIKFNIDGCSWLYEGVFNEIDLQMQIEAVICGTEMLANGVIEQYYYDKNSDRIILSFSTATSPSQVFSIGGRSRDEIRRHTNERILGIKPGMLSTGEDASFTSYDDTRISARLYLPSSRTSYKPPFPLVYYIHGGPQSQERPDFSWFSIPLIQLLTMKGYAVFVPNVRGSTGYGLKYMKQVDRDWGGKDRLDHVFAMQEILPKDKRLDISRSGVVGRSYGGYMTLTLAGRHPELWSAAVDMFGPYDLINFSKRIPEPWKPYFSIALGDPVTDRDFLIERSPNTYINNIDFPLLVIQGKNDPRVVEQESRELVNELIKQGKEIEYLFFENEGHDILKYENRVTCYNRIIDFFLQHLNPTD